MTLLAPKRTRAFTFVEISVIIVVIIVMALVTTPRLAAMKRGDDVRRTKSDLATLISNGRARAMSSGQTIVVTFDENSDELQMGDNAEERQIFGQVELGDEISAESFQIGADDVAAADWRLELYSDGSSNKGAIQFDVGGGAQTLTISKLAADVAWIEGEIPPTSEDRWQAGELEVRQ